MRDSSPDWIARSKLVLFPLFLCPLFWLLWSGFGGGLGPDPAKTFVDQNGLWAFRFLLLCLAMTPLRYLTRRSFWGRYRRMLGLFAFFYACVHVISYVFLLFGGRWSEIVVELAKRPYIMVGAMAFVMLIPLAITSTRGWQRKMGRGWVRLHTLIYPAGFLVLLHFLWVKKLGLEAIWPYALLLVLLIGMRIWKRYTLPQSKV
ncbi:MAG: sulfoxide reductase heme-binding subunit YedZ [Moraxellaceae bacterium]|jgi:sulfoxide reductase heme-binding subunit YedZ|nr:sulfoxide reductase heme-binding subunit YedZ [Moraxellaceae bacterium]